MPDVSSILIGEASVPYRTTLSQNPHVSALSYDSGVVYAIQAAGGYQTDRTFDSIRKLSETLIGTFDTTNALEVLFDVRTFNNMIGIVKDTNNIGVLSSDYYDVSNDMLYKDSLTLNALDFVTGVSTDISNIVSVGALSTIYADYSRYIQDWFSTNATAAYPTQGTFHPNGDIFDASAFLQIIGYDNLTPDDHGGFITGLGGSITVSNITQLLRNAVDANVFGNRDPFSGTTASDPANPANYGVTDGFLENDLIFIPNNGMKVKLELSIIGNVTQNPTATYDAMTQDAALVSNTIGPSAQTPGQVNSAFTSNTSSRQAHGTEILNFLNQNITTEISKTVSVPLLIRLANLSNSSAPASVSIVSVGSTNVAFRVSGSYTDYTVTRIDRFSQQSTKVINPTPPVVSNLSVISDLSCYVFTQSQMVDMTVSPSTYYDYVFQPYLNTTILPAIDVSNIRTLDAGAMITASIGSIGAESLQVKISGIFTRVDVQRNGSLNLITNYTGSSYLDITNITPNTAYYYAITPYNIQGVVGNVARTATVFTLSKVVLQSFVASTNQIQFVVTGQFTLIRAYRTDAPTQLLPLTLSQSVATFTSPNLPVNTSFSYMVVSKNASGVETSYGPYTFSTLPVLNSVSQGIRTTDTQVHLLFSGSYSGLTIERVDGGTGLNYVNLANTLQKTDTSFVDTYQIASDVSYVYTVTPLASGSGAAGTSIQTTAYTLPVLTSSVSDVVITTNAIQLKYKGLYLQLKLYRDNVLLTTNYNGNNTTNTYLDVSLNANTTYNYSLVPYNQLNQAGNSVTFALRTLPILTSAVVSSDASNQIVLSFTGSYAYVSVARTPTFANALPVQVSGSTFVDTQIVADTSYTYLVTPYNVSNQANVPSAQRVFVYSLSWIFPSSITAQVVNTSNTGIQYVSKTSTINGTVYGVNLGFQGQYSYITIARNGTALIPSGTLLQGTAYQDAGPLTPSTTYNYALLPYDPSDNAGYSASLNVTTPPLITSVTFVPASTSMGFTLTGTYVSFNVRRVDFNQTAVSWTNRTGTSFVDTDVSFDNNVYVYYFTPVSLTNVQGDTMDITVNSPPSVQPLTSALEDLTATSARIRWTTTSVSYAYVRLLRGTTPLQDISYGATKSYLDASLSSNTTYSYTAIPFNTYDISGPSTSVTLTTLSTLASFAITNVTTNAIALAWSGTYDRVVLARPLFSVTSRDVSYVDTTALVPSTLYNYTLTAYDRQNRIGSVLSDVSAYTLPQITRAVNTTVDASNAVILNVSGGFSYIQSMRNDGIGATISGTGTYTDLQSIHPNTTYTYTLTPYNPRDVSGVAYTLTTFTYPYISSMVTSAISNTTVTIGVDGSYSYLKMNIYDGTTLQQISTITTNVYLPTDISSTDLSSNTNYLFVVTPYNADNVAGSSASLDTNTLPDVTVYTNPVNGDSNISGATQFSITLDGNASYYRVTGTSTRDLTIAPPFSWYQMPYNTALEVIASEIVTWSDDLTMDLGADPYGMISQISPAETETIRTASVRVLNSVDVSFNGNVTSYTLSNLGPNTVYTFYLYSYNQTNQYTVSTPIQYVTLPTLAPLQYSNLTASSVTLNMTGQYSYVKVYRDDVLLGTTTQNYYTDLSMNEGKPSYVYTVIPYNIADVAGSIRTDAQTIIVGPLPLLNRFEVDVSSVKSDSMRLVLDGSFDYAQIYNITTVENGTNATVNFNWPVMYDGCMNIYSIGSSLTVPVSGLTSNAFYQFMVIPYSLISSQTGVSLAVQITMPTVLNDVQVTAKDASSVTLTLDGSFQYFTLNRQILPQYYGNVVTMTNLNANAPYQFFVTPYNNEAIANTSSAMNPTNTALPVYTWGKVTDVSWSTTNTVSVANSGTRQNYSIGSTKTSTLQFTYGGIYSYVVIQNTTNGQVYYPTTNVFCETNLMPNTVYRYALTPYNAQQNANDAGRATTVQIMTMPLIFNVAVDNTTDATSIRLNMNQLITYVSYYDYINVYRDGVLVVSNADTLKLRDSYLTPNSSYVYTVVPYTTKMQDTLGDVSGNPYTIRAYTRPMLTTQACTMNQIGTKDATFAFDGSYSYVRVTCTDMSGNLISTSDDISGNAFVQHNLLPNRTYRFVLVPYNAFYAQYSPVNMESDTDICGTHVVFPSVTTTSALSRIAVVATTDTTATLDFGDAASYASVTVNYTVNDVSFTATTYDASLTLTDLDLVNATYTCQVVSANSQGTPGMTYTVTLGQDMISSFEPSSVSANSIVLSLAGTYDYVVIQCNDVPITTVYEQSYTITNVGLDQYTPYVYTATPYVNSVAGTSEMVMVYTLMDTPTLTSTMIQLQDVSAISLYLDGTYSYVKIYRNDEYLDLVGYVPNGQVYQDTAGLLPDETYVYKLVPYGNSLTDGTVVVGSSYLLTGYTKVVMQTLYGVQLTMLEDTQSIRVYFPGEFTTVNIARNDDVIDAGRSTDTFVDAAITPNTYYQYSVIPFDQGGNIGDIQDASIVSLPKVVATLQEVTSSSVTLQFNGGVFDGSYTSLTISRNGIQLVSEYTSSTFTDSSLNALADFGPNSVYAYVVTPYNSVGQSSKYQTVRVTSLPLLVSEATVSNITSSSALLSFSGVYSYVNIYRSLIDGTSTLIESKYTSDTYQDNELSPNVTYGYSVVPYNASDASGTPIATAPFTTFSLVEVSVLSKTSTAITYQFSGSYTSVDVYNCNGTPFKINMVSNGSATTTVSNLITNTGYRIGFMPVNAGGVGGHDVADKMSYAHSVGGNGVIYTYGSVTQFDMLSVSTSSILMRWQGSFKTVMMYRADQPTVPIPSVSFVNNMYRDIKLNPNTVYSYVIYPVNIGNEVSPVSTLLTGVVTWPMITSVVQTRVTQSQVDLSFNGYYDHVQVYRTPGWGETLPYVTVTGNSFTDASFDPINYQYDTEYSYAFVPYNSANIQGTSTSTLFKVSSIAMVSQAALTALNSANTVNQSMQLVLDGSYDYVNMDVTTDGQTVFSASSIYSRTYKIDSLLADTPYQINIIPFSKAPSPNALDSSGAMVVASGKTYPYLNPLSIRFGTITTTSVTISLTSAGTTSRTTFVDISGSSLPNSTVAVSMDSSCTNVGLAPNTLYTYDFYPRNEVGANVSYIRQQVYTAPVITDVSFHDNFLEIYGSFQYFVLTRKDTNVPTRYYATDTSAVTQTTVFDGSLSIANNPLSYTIVPYNPNDISGTSITVNTTVFPRVSLDSWRTVSSTSVVLSFSGLYDNLALYRNDVLLTYVTGSTVPVTDTFTDTKLTPNTGYKYTVIPLIFTSGSLTSNFVLDVSNGNRNVKMGKSAVSYTIYTLPSMTAAVGSAGSSDIALTFGGNYHYISISRNGQIVNSRVGYDTNSLANSTVSVYQDGSLNTNTSYVYACTPYSRFGTQGDVSGTTVNVTTCTLGQLASVTTYASAMRSLQLDVSGVYQYYKVYRTDIPGFVDASTNKVYRDASANLRVDASYTYVVTPYNIANAPGASLNYTAYTLPALGYVNLSSSTPSTIALDISGQFAYVKVQRNGATIASNVPTNNEWLSRITYTDPTLAPNTQYKYTVTPYNRVDVSNVSIDASFTSQPVLNTLTLGSVDTSSSIQLLFSGVYDAVNITRNGTAISTALVGSSFTDTGLSADTSYNYVVTPLTSATKGSVQGTSVSLLTTTQPTLTNVVARTVKSMVGTTVTGSVVLDMSGAFAYVDICRNQVYQGRVTTTKNTLGAWSYNDVSAAANTSYTYTVIPYATSDGITSLAGSTTTASVVSLPSIGVSVPVCTITSITYQFTGSYQYMDISYGGAIVSGGSRFTGTTYTASNLNAAGNAIYTYQFTPYNSAGVTNTSILYTASTLPTVLTVDSSYVDGVNTVSYTGNYTDVQVYRYDIKGKITLIKDVSSNLTPGVKLSTSYMDTSPTSGTVIWYRVIPYNVNRLAGTYMDSSSVVIPIKVTILSTSSTNNSISATFDGSYNYSYGYLNGALVSKPMAYIGVPYTYTFMNLMADTSYSCDIRCNVAGSPLLFSTVFVVRTAAAISTVLPRNITSNSVHFDVSGAYSSYSVSWAYASTPTSSSTSSGQTALSFSTGAILSAGRMYIFTFTSYNALGQPSPYVFQLSVKTLPATFINDGWFASSVAANANLLLPNPALLNWNASYTSDAGYYLAGKTGKWPLLSFYSGTLPSLVDTYFVACNSTKKAYQTVKLSQTVTLSTGVMYYLCFYVFPGANIDTNHTLSVSVGNINLLYNASFGNDTSLPYLTYTLPFRVPDACRLPVVFTFNSPTASDSQICVAGIQIISTPTALSSIYQVGVQAVDYAGLVCYYCLDSQSSSDPGNYTYASSAGSFVNYALDTQGSVSDASMIRFDLVGNNGSVSGAANGLYYSSNLTLGATALFLDATNSQYISIGKTLTLPTLNLNNPTLGFSVTGWVCPVGVQKNLATIFSCSNPSYSNTALLSVFYRAINHSQEVDITFAAGDGNGTYTEKTVSGSSIASRTWMFFAFVVTYNPLTSDATYTGYVNDVSVCSFNAPWPSCGSYTTNTVGYANNMDYFNGAVHEFRVYTRALSTSDIWSLWNFGMLNLMGGLSDVAGSNGNYASQTSSFSVIDPYAMTLYCTFESNTMALALTPSSPLANLFTFVDVSNGKFHQPAVRKGISTLATTANMGGWTVTADTGTAFYVSDTTSYAYGLPQGMSQYLKATVTQAATTASPSAPATARISQNVGIQVPSNMSSVTYILSFQAFPVDGSYNAAHTLTVMVGNVVLLSDYTLSVSNGTVPYNSLNLPFRVTTSGTYTVQFVFSSKVVVTSNLGLSNVRVTTTAFAGTGYQAIDTTGLTLYYPWSSALATNVGTNLYDYAGGSGALKATLCQVGTTVQALPLPRGTTLFGTGPSQTVSGLTGSDAFANGTYSFSSYPATSTTNIFNRTATSTLATSTAGMWTPPLLTSYTTDVQYNTLVSGVVQKGAWIQINLPYALQLTSYTLVNYMTSGASLSEFYVVGSNDGANWTQVDYRHENFPISTTGYNYTCTLGAVSDNYYSVYRLIATRSVSSPRVSTWWLNGNVAAPLSPTLQTTSVVLGSAALALSNQQYLTVQPKWMVEDVSKLVPGLGFSATGWFNASALPADGDTVFSFNGTEWTYASTMSLSFQRTTKPYLRFFATGAVEIAVNTVPIVPNTWYFYAVVANCLNRNGSTQYTFYLNNVAVATVSGQWPTTHINSYTTMVSRYYENYIGSNRTKTAFFSGSLQDLRWYTRSLSSNDVLALWKYGVMQPSVGVTPIDPSATVVNYGNYYTVGEQPAAVVSSASTDAPKVYNGSFDYASSLYASSRTPVVNQNVAGWTFSKDASYTLLSNTVSDASGASVAGTYYYSYLSQSNLPMGATKALVMIGNEVATQPATMSQSVFFNVTGSTTYILNFSVFFAEWPLAGYSYQTTHTLTVSVGNQVVLSKYALPYNARLAASPPATLNLPFVIDTSGYYTLTFTFSNGPSVKKSNLSITAIQILLNQPNAVVIDTDGATSGIPSNRWNYDVNTLNPVDVRNNTLTHYYPFETDSSNGVLYSYTSGSPTSSLLTTNYLSTNANCVLWLDASGTSNFQLSGANVVKWLDKSGLGNDAVLSGSWYTTYNATGMNGLPAVNFDASYTAVTGMSAPISPSAYASAGLTVVVVFASAPTAATTASGELVSIVSGTSASPMRVYGTTRVQNGNTDGSNTVYTTAGTDVRLQTTPTLFSMTDMSGSWQEWTNGVLDMSASVSTGFSGVGTQFRLGGGYGFAGNVSEVLVYRGVLSTQARQSVEGALARKWRISLPTTHPFFNPFFGGCSTVGTTSPVFGNGCLALNAANQQYLILPDPLRANLTTATTSYTATGFSASSWVYPTGTAQQSNACLLSLDKPSGNNLRVYYDGTNASLLVKYGALELTAYNAVLTPATWNHVVLTVSLTEISMYLNGVRVSNVQGLMTAPATPTITGVTSAGTTATVTFMGSAGGVAYTAVSSPGGVTASSSTSPMVVTGLNASTAYTFVLVARNATGASAPTAASASVTTGLSTPTDVSATASVSEASAKVAFTGSTGATSYTATSSPGGVTATGSSSPITVLGLTNGTSYTFTVTASGSTGPSLASAASNTVTTVPLAPTAVTASLSGAMAVVSFTGSAGAASYTVTSSPGGMTASSSSSPISVAITDLTPAKAYTFTVVAVNSAGGTSAASTASNAIGAPPLAPTNVTASVSGSIASVSFTAATGATSYTVTSSPGGYIGTASASPIQVFLGGQGSYTFTVTTTALTGTSVASTASNVVTVTAPMAPTNVSATMSGTTGVVSFTASTGATSYTATSSPGGLTGTLNSTASGTLSVLVNGLVVGTTYTFTVIASNPGGNSTASSASNAIPMVYARIVDGTITPSWNWSGAVYSSAYNSNIANTVSGPGSWDINFTNPSLLNAASFGISSFANKTITFDLFMPSPSTSSWGALVEFFFGMNTGGTVVREPNYSYLTAASSNCVALTLVSQQGYYSSMIGPPSQRPTPSTVTNNTLGFFTNNICAPNNLYWTRVRLSISSAKGIYLAFNPVGGESYFHYIDGSSWLSGTCMGFNGISRFNIDNFTITDYIPPTTTSTVLYSNFDGNYNGWTRMNSSGTTVAASSNLYLAYFYSSYGTVSGLWSIWNETIYRNFNGIFTSFLNKTIQFDINSGFQIQLVFGGSTSLNGVCVSFSVDQFSSGIEPNTADRNSPTSWYFYGQNGGTISTFNNGEGAGAINYPTRLKITISSAGVVSIYSTNCLLMSRNMSAYVSASSNLFYLGITRGSSPYVSSFMIFDGIV